MSLIPPFLPFFIAAALLPLLGINLRRVVLLATPLIGGYLLLQLPSDLVWQTQIAALELTPLRVDRLSLLFGYLFHIAAFIGLIYAQHVRDRAEQMATLVYAGSALGAVFAGDLLTLFIFWELLAVSSVVLIWSRKSALSGPAGMRYLMINILSGVLLLAGAAMLYRGSGSLSFDWIGAESLSGQLILLAFGIKAAFPFVHNWLTDGYPEATVSGTVFLSAFTTKVAIYALARGFAGTDILITIGALMACFPIFYAVIENDLRRVLAYSMINQLGFMVVGIGIGTELALNGAVAHAFNDVLFKGLLMMAMGAVLYRTGRMNGSDLGGLYKSMPKTTVLCIVGAASISAFPLFNGFVSKSMIMSAVSQEQHHWVWFGLLFASAGVFHHAGIKIPFFAFFAHDSGLRVKEAPLHMLLAMSLSAMACLAIGFHPTLLYDLLPYPVDYSPYDASHVLAQLQLLFFSAAAFAWLKVSGIYPPELHSTNLDAEWLYRRLAPNWISHAGGWVGHVYQRWRKTTEQAAPRLLRSLNRDFGAGSTVGGDWPTGNAVLWVMVLLGISVVLFQV